MKRRTKRKILTYAFLFFFAWGIYYELWGKHLYVVTAYCNCPICINVKEYQDGRFASGRRIYWGAVATDSKIPFGTDMKLVPLLPQDWFAVAFFLKGKRDFVVEDRGGKVRGKHIDLFISDSLGGHQTAKNWGRRKMRLKVNGEWAE